MTRTMRQRLLLFVGWLLAAIGAGLVASGAVAIAGGQVLDRALQPLTAAEVAALPVVTVGSSDIVEPHASGGLVSTAGEPTDSSDAEAPDQTGSVDDGRGSASDSGSSAPVDPFTAPTHQVAIETNEGGGASFVVDDEAIIMLWASPNAGYIVQLRATTPTLIRVSFTSTRNVWVIEASIDNGQLAVDSRQVPLT